jgi:hypothetical protein
VVISFEYAIDYPKAQATIFVKELSIIDILKEDRLN